MIQKVIEVFVSEVLNMNKKGMSIVENEVGKYRKKKNLIPIKQSINQNININIKVV